MTQFNEPKKNLMFPPQPSEAYLHNTLTLVKNKMDHPEKGRLQLFGQQMRLNIVAPEQTRGADLWL